MISLTPLSRVGIAATLLVLFLVIAVQPTAAANVQDVQVMQATTTTIPARMMVKVELDPGASATYNFAVEQNKQVLVAAVNLSWNETYNPKVQVTCSGTLDPSTGQRTNGGAVICTPSSNSTAGVTVTAEGAAAKYSYAVFAIRVDALNIEGTAGLNMDRSTLRADGPMALDLRGYSFENTSDSASNTNRTLSFSTDGPSDRMVWAAIYRADGSRRCFILRQVVSGSEASSSASQSTCQVYDANRKDYHIVIGNASNGLGDASKIGYTIKLQQ